MESTIASFRSRARDGAFARLAAGDAWPNVRHTSLITSCRTLPCAKPRAPWRAAVVASAGSEWSDSAAAVCPVADEGDDCAGRRRPRGYLWAELMRRTFGIDVLDCPRCGGRLRLLALIEHVRILERILGHSGLPTDRPKLRPARAPPQPVCDPEQPIERDGCDVLIASAAVCLAAARPPPSGRFDRACRASPVWRRG
jgi:hypothetical protein